MALTSASPEGHQSPPVVAQWLRSRAIVRSRRWPHYHAKCTTLFIVAVALAVLGQTGLAAAATGQTFIRWQRAVASPQPVAAVASRDQTLYRLCGQPDIALMRAAGLVVDRQLDGLPPFTGPELKLVTRAAGLPQAWPRAWSATNITEPAKLRRRLRRWLAQRPVAGIRRCGIARGFDQQSQPVLAVVAVDALADLRPMPTRVRLSQWVSLDGVMRTAAQGVTVMLLGPRGRPRRVLSSLSGGRIRSRFALDLRGSWLVQVLAMLPSGPQPIFEVQIFADVAPPTALFARAVPGEPSFAGHGADAVFAMLQAARRSEKLGALRRDSRLDRVAQAHAQAMLRSRMVAHDLGAGTPDQRVAASGLVVSQVGENVAAATSEVRAHRVLWASPSHRENMLLTAYRRVGVAAVSDAAGTWWVAQVFTD